jgi:hypothetical protein
MKQHPALPGRSLLLAMLAFLAAGSAYGGTCSSPTGNEGDIKYNGNYHTYQFCNGTNWIAYGGGGSCTATSPGYSPTVPSGSGYFVLTKGTYTGNLGGLAGADSTCLTELTTNTGWLGYSTANANGQLIASKVHAWMCNFEICDDFEPLTVYYFANAGNASAGGAYFMSDVNGYGFSDNADWAAENYFGGTYNIWTGREQNLTESTIANTWAQSGYACSGWTSASSANIGEYGISSSTTSLRWGGGYGAGYQALSCNIYAYLICFVNP